MMATSNYNPKDLNPGELILVAANSPGEVVAQLRRSPEDMGMDLRDYARASQRCFKASAPIHIAVVAKDEGDLLNKAELVAATLKSKPDKSFVQNNEIFYDCRTKTQN